MFPESYAKNYMSLTQGKNRLTTSYYLEVTTDGEILLDRLVFKKAVVNVNKKLRLKFIYCGIYIIYLIPSKAV